MRITLAIVDAAPIYLGKQKGFFANRQINLTLVQTLVDLAVADKLLEKAPDLGTLLP